MATAPDIFIPQHKRQIVTDATLFSTIMGCGRLVDFRFNHNLLSLNGKSNSLECGNIAHKYFEIYYGHVIKGFVKSQAHGMGMAAAEMYARGCSHCMRFKPTLCDDHSREGVTLNSLCPNCVLTPPCGHKPQEYPGCENTPYEKEKDYQIGWKWVLETCDQYYEFYKNDYWVPLEVERVKGKILYTDDEIEILWKAKFDLISDTTQAIMPIDHKTMKQRRDNISLNNQFMGQCILAETQNMVINKVGFQTSLKAHEKFVRATMSYSRKRLNEWQGTILPYWIYKYLDYLDNDYWAPNFDHCENKYGNCTFIEVCSADPEERERELKLNFYVGEDWNPTNDED